MVSPKRAYGLTTPFLSVFPDPITKTIAPTVSDKNYPNGFIWIYKNGDERTSYTYGGLNSNGDAVWIVAGQNPNDITDLTISQSPLLQSNDTLGSAPTGATGDINLMALQDGTIMEQVILGPGQTIIAPRMTENGLSIGLDNIFETGAEYNFGARNNAKHVYTIGTSRAFFMEASFYVEDISGSQPLVIGFRKVEDNVPLFGNYTDLAVIGLRTIAPINVVLTTRLNEGLLTTTDTTDPWGGDGAVQTVKVLVSGSGSVTYEIAGSTPTVTAPFTFDNGDLVMPFIYFLHSATLADEVTIQTLKIGFQNEV